MEFAAVLLEFFLEWRALWLMAWPPSSNWRLFVDEDVEMLQLGTF
jgi:hypothetical protein